MRIRLSIASAKKVKNMRSVLWLLLFVGIANLPLLAQPVGKSSYEMRVAVAAEKAAEKDYYNAVVLYEEAYEERKDERLIPLMAELNLKLRDYTRAQRYYAQALRRDKAGKMDELRFNYGRALKMNGEYAEAIPEFRKFLETNPSDSLRELAEQEIAGAELALSYANETPLVQVAAADKDVNSPFSEYAPVFGRDGSLFYTGFKQSEVIIVDEENTDYHSKIYVTSKEEDPTKGWKKPDSLGQEINRPGFHTGNAAFSSDGRILFFTRAQLKGNELSESKIYFSVGGDRKWNGAEEVAGVNGDYLARHPAVGELFGKSVLFFSSNQEGGFGGYDLYYATQKGEGVYGDPVNLGPKINTPGDEITPFFFGGTLYFSSNGLAGLGGQDIFYTAWNGAIWSEPRNMGPGFNSPQDDQYLVLSSDGYTGAFTSNRPGGRSVRSKTCCDDIYSFEIEKVKVKLVAGIFDIRKKQLNGATIEVIPVEAAGEGSPVAQTNPTGNGFEFPLDLEKTYKIKISRQGFYPDSLVINTTGITRSKTFEQRFYLKQLPPPPVEPEYDTITTEQAIVLENILYDFNDDKIKPESEGDLSVVLNLLNEYPTMKIELSSHTDYRGNDQYNEALSQRRAESAKRWLLAKGVAPERIVAKGYGEKVPQTISARIAQQDSVLREGDVLTQAYIDSLETEVDKERAHSINRRTEFRILEGPTTITIKRTSLRKQPAKTVPVKNAYPAAVPQDTNPTPTISSLSSLRGRKDLRGVPIMQFKERVIDFGAVQKGEQRQHIYFFTNEGDTPLKISLISACDCTTTEYSTEPVPPGGKGQILVRFDSTEKDADETIDIDIFLDNNEPDTGHPIMERLQYKFKLIK